MKTKGLELKEQFCGFEASDGYQRDGGYDKSCVSADCDPWVLRFWIPIGCGI